MEIISIRPMYAYMLGTCVLTVTAAAEPNVTRNPSVINVADLALPDVGKPSLNRPEARKIMPMNMVKSETACIPSMKVLAIPEREIPTPTMPIEVRPIPGVIRSQSVILLDVYGGLLVILNRFF
jgi:hypothetical protein